MHDVGKRSPADFLWSSMATAGTIKSHQPPCPCARYTGRSSCRAQRRSRLYSQIRLHLFPGLPWACLCLWVAAHRYRCLSGQALLTRRWAPPQPPRRHGRSRPRGRLGPRSTSRRPCRLLHRPCSKTLLALMQLLHPTAQRWRRAFPIRVPCTARPGCSPGVLALPPRQSCAHGWKIKPSALQNSQA